MLTIWQVENFKSYKNPGPISLKMINVLAGANSSGKSTIIQSLLLLKQTVQYGAQNRSLTLNGPIIRLGSYRDILNSGCDGEGISIKLTFDFAKDEGSGARNHWVRDLNRRLALGRSGQISNLKLNLTFSDGGGDTPNLFDNRLSTINPDLNSIYLSINEASREKSSHHFLRMDKEYIEDDDLEIGFPYSVSMDSRSEAEAREGRPDAVVLGAYNNQFLPSWIGVKYNSSIKEIDNILDGIFSRDSFASQADLNGILIADEATEVLNRWLLERDVDPLSGHITAADVKHALKPFLDKTSYVNIMIGRFTQGGEVDEIKSKLESLRKEFARVLVANLEADYDFDPVTTDAVGRASAFVRTYLKEGVKYLGPLRDSPRPVYQPEALESTTDVGYRGEHTAAILEINSQRQVRYYLPPSTDISATWAADQRPRVATLHDAVVDWLQYLGVAGEVKTTDAGVYGNRLQVATSYNGNLHDLTNVGVGVSQVLPIVVMSLLAPQGSLLIFEQPELHLHPRVQARLADFFISLSWDQKQTLLETHSEYLIDRLRLRIALSRGDDLLDSVNILFSEKDGDRTELRTVALSEFGSVVDWPKDFFDQSQGDVAQIIKAAAEKRRSARQ